MAQPIEIPGVPRQHQKLPWRQAYVPSWYEPHMDMAVPVLRGDGTPFAVKGTRVTIGMIPPERRWALWPDGMMVDQGTFKERWQLYIVGLYQLAKGKAESLEHYPIPNVEYFLSFTEASDGSHKLVMIGYDPNRPRPTLVPPRPANDEPVVDPSIMARGWKAAPGEKTEEERQAELMNQAYQAEISIRFYQLEELLNQGLLTKAAFDQKVAELTGQPVQSEPRPMTETEAVVEPAERHYAICGKALKDRRGKAAHQRFCKACRKILIQTPDPAPEATPEEA